MTLPNSVSRQRTGVALIITLIMVAMLALLVVAFFSRTTANRQIESASTGGVRAEMLARSSADAVVADLRAEMIAGSLAVTPSQNQPVYIPLPSGKTIVPSRVLRSSISLTDPVYVNLVKQSAEENPFFTKDPPPSGVTTGIAAPMIPKATKITTDIPSLNLRSVSFARWQSAELTGKNAFVDTNVAPTINKYLPEWVMVTRKGITADAQTVDKMAKLKDYTPREYAADDPGSAIGRFAFNVYDIGGLLDVNAIGYPKSLNLGAGDDIQELKGSQTGADLSVFFTSSPSNTPIVRNIDLFAKSWKYLTSGGNKDTFLSTWRTTTQNGYLRPAPGDNVAMGRQDLIRLAKKKVVGGTDSKYGVDGIEDETPSALPYLTHFSRELNAPSWFPTQDASATRNTDGTFGTDGTPIAPGAPKPYAYKSNANNGIVPNRAFPGVLVTQAFTRGTDGTQAVVGEPLVKTRFALSRLKALGPNGIVTTENGKPLNTTLINGVLSPATDVTVQRDFGLRWEAGSASWQYVGPSGTTPQSAIKTLNQVATTAGGGREANFFELLKAGILSGSLGDTSDYESFCANIGYDSNSDAQVIQIGANIIDQADTDSFPTRIAFGSEVDWSPGTNLLSPLSSANKPSPLAGAPSKIYSGVEDLPYIHSFVVTPYRRPPGQPNLGGASPPTVDQNQTAAREYVNCWLQFVLWKPQQQATPTGGAPTKFRILYTNSDPTSSNEGMYVDYWGPGDNGDGTQVTWPTFPVPGASFFAKNTAPPLPGGTAVTFDDTASSFRAPALLGGMGSSSDNNFNCSQNQGKGGGTGDSQLPRGMWLGEVYRPERIPAPLPGSETHASAPAATFFELDAANDSRFELQYDSGGAWRTYQRYDRFGMGTPRSGGGFRGRGRYGFTDPGSSGSGSSAKPPYYGATATSPHYATLNVAGMGLTNADPRSQRFGLMAMYQRASGPDTVPTPPNPPAPGDWINFLKQGWSPTAGKPITAVYGPSNAARFSPSWTGGAGPNSNPWGGPPSGTSGGFIPSSSPINDPSKFFVDDLINGGEYYKDMDGIARRGDGDSTNGVRPMQLTNATSVNSKVMSPMLNRPFRSVGELSYVFRDNPWKTLDFFSSNSADAALLDIFSVAEQPSIVAGKLNLNTRNVVALQALLSGALREESTAKASQPNLVEATSASSPDISAATMAAKLVANTSDVSGNPNTGPLLNVADLANRLQVILPVSSSAPDPFDPILKTRREVVSRALAGAGQTHTWNLMVDVIAQSGRYPVNATKLDQFVVEGEKRYWLHVAIDRLTGQVVDQQLESVNE